MPSADKQGNDLPPDIFSRLEERGIDYPKVKMIVQFGTPHDTLFIAQWFKGKTIERVFRHLEEWDDLLRRDFALSLSEDLKGQVKRFIRTTELMAVRALIEANPTVGSWDIHVEPIPTGRDEKRRSIYIRPLWKIVATHRKTKKIKAVQIPCDALYSLATTRNAFEKLGLWNELWKGDLSRKLTSQRAPQGWPVYTRLVIPRLYEFLAPHYQSAGHHWAKHGAAEPRRCAQFPQQLLRDMLDILRLEYPHVFKETTLRQLTSDVQRHLARKNTK